MQPVDIPAVSNCLLLTHDPPDERWVCPMTA